MQASEVLFESYSGLQNDATEAVLGGSHRGLGIIVS